MRHVGDGLLDKLDDALSEALHKIRDGDAAKATVTLAFSITVDDEGEEEFTYTLKAARGAKGEWRPGSGQPRLPFEGKNGAEKSITQEVVDGLNAQGIPAEVVTR
jgi:hypothetical protein